MRELEVRAVTENIKEMCIEANHVLSYDMKKALRDAADAEDAPLGKQVLKQLLDNMEIAQKDMIPICQDTGMTVIFLEIGQNVHFAGGDLSEAVQEGVRQGYEEGFLRKSVVKDPIFRDNTKDNTPAVIHYEIVPGDKVRITVAPKGFGSENMSRVFMLKPADGIEGVKNVVLTNVNLISKRSNAGGVVGYSIGSSIINCHVKSGEIKSHSNNVGSIAGRADGGSVLECTNSAVISGVDFIGGIVG